MRYACLAVLAVGLLPMAAKAEHPDRGRFDVSIGFGYSSSSYRDRYEPSYRHSSYRERAYCPPPVYCPPPRVYYREPAYCPPPRVYYREPVRYYSSHGHHGRTYSHHR